MIIKEYEESYRDDLIFMILSAKDALRDLITRDKKKEAYSLTWNN